MSTGSAFRLTDVADYLGVSMQRVGEMRQEGLLPEPELIDNVGAQWKPATIERWAKEWWDTRRWKLKP